MTEGTTLKHDVLDHGYLRYVDHMGTDDSVVRNARVSYNGKVVNEDYKLINYLMRNGHNTPFESCEIQFEIKAPIFVVRQWHRHRTQSYNEVSARYTELPNEYYLPDESQITTQHKDNKQMRTDDVNEEADMIRAAIFHQNEAAFEVYKMMLDKGCPREIARSVLPFGTYTRFFAKSNLHNWFHFLAERLHPHAQYEIMVYAKAILKILEQFYPESVRAFKEFRIPNYEKI